MSRIKQAAVITILLLILVVGCVSVWLYVNGYFKPSPQQATQPTTQPLPQQPVTKNQLACINSLPMNIKIGQKLMVAGYNSQLTDEAPIFKAAAIGGIIIMDQASGEQLARFRLAQIMTPFIATDQEGGTVQRYIAEGNLPGATDMAGNFSLAQAYDQYLKDDQYLKSIGITTNFAPIVDVISITPSPLPGRMYSYSPSVVVQYATQSIKAARTAGITPVIKHFPGLGSASGNTDYGSATIDPIATLRTRDLIPYIQLATLRPDVMVSNAIVPGLTDGQPAVWSSAAISLLRSEGYQQAVIYSDSLTAKAVPGSLSDAVVKAWKAGVDVALIVQTKDQTIDLTAYFTAIQASAAAALQSGQLSNDSLTDSVSRILIRKNIDPCELKA